MPRHRRGWAMGGAHGPRTRHSPMMVALLEPLLLMLLKEKAVHGYTLAAELQEMGLESIHPSVIYRILREMEALGWIESQWDSGASQGPPRRNYSLTPDGESAMNYWRIELAKTNTLITQFLDRTSY